MKVKFDFNLETVIRGLEMEGSSIEDAENKIYKMTLQEILDEVGDIRGIDFDISDVDYEITEKEVVVNVDEIQYKISGEQLEASDYDNWDDLIESLPTQLNLRLVLENDDDIVDAIYDVLEDELEYEVADFMYSIVETK